MKNATYMKIAAGVAVVVLVWLFLRMRSNNRRHKIIVTQMPVVPVEVPGDEGDDLYTTIPPSVATATPAKTESYAEWEPEGYDEYSDVQFKQDLLE